MRISDIVKSLEDEMNDMGTKIRELQDTESKLITNVIDLELENKLLKKRIEFIDKHLRMSLDCWNNKILDESANIEQHTCKLCKADKS